MLYIVASFLLNILIYGIILITIVRCVKDKIRLKIVFLIMIVFLIYFGTYVVDGDQILTFGFWVGWRFSEIGLASNGDLTAEIVVPAGAIAYWCVRKGLVKKVENAEFGKQN